MFKKKSNGTVNGGKTQFTAPLMTEEQNKEIEAILKETRAARTPVEEQEMNETKSEEERNRRKLWKQEAKEKAVEYLKQLRSVKGEEKEELKKKLNKSVKSWEKSLSSLNIKEKKDQKKAYKAFKRRRNRLPRTIISWTLIAALVAAVWSFGGTTIGMLARVLFSQQGYTDKTVDAVEARKNGELVAAEICDEGYVLLKNDFGFLPLSKGTKINIIGDDAYNFVFGGSGSAGADMSGAVSLFDAFRKGGLQFNEDLNKYYASVGLTEGGADSSIKAMIVSYFSDKNNKNDWHDLTDEQLQKAYQYSDTALIVLSSQEVEGNEIDLSLLQPTKGDSIKANLIRRACECFDHVIIIVNSGNVMELAFMEEYEHVDACLWVGAPGACGCTELVRVLLGEVNPSGRTVDTWPISIEEEPGYIYYERAQFKNNPSHYYQYADGIYVGYRYYETWYGTNALEYAKKVLYPFGYGLSYTDFTERITYYNIEDGMIRVDVKVSNIGKYAGKDVVELYFAAPYNKEGGIEKSAIELANYAKTSLLQPGESETLTLSFNMRDMSSYSEELGCYVLEKGLYNIVIGKNVHNALVGKRGFTYQLSKGILYREDDVTGTEISNLFDFAACTVDGLSRETLNKAKQYTKRASMGKSQLAEREEYERAASIYSDRHANEPVYKAKNDIMLAQLKGLAYDDAKWDKFLDQFSIKELIKLQSNGGWHTEAIKGLGITGAKLLDGPSGINSMMSSVEAIGYPVETVVASSWNTEMAKKLGDAIADEAKALGVNAWYAPAVNIHRTAVGGRNAEYFSEDPYLSGTMAAAAIKAAQDKGIIACVKHFVCNDLEQFARDDVCIFVDEQALREIYLRPFEIAVKEGGAKGMMSSFSRLGSSQWCGGSYALLTKLLREEWGFSGIVTTDACLGSWMNAELGAKAGNNLMLDMGICASQKVLKEAYKADPVGVSWALRECVHEVLYTLVNSTNLY